MTREQAIASLLRLTHSWRAVAPTAAEHVAEARRMIGLALLADQAEPLIRDQGPPASADHDPTALSQIELAVAEALLELARIAPSVPPRIFLRALPVLTHHDPAAVPTWAAGRACTRTVGPFMDGRGFHIWVDSYEPAPHVAFARGNSNIPFLLVPGESAFQNQERMNLTGGTVWIFAQAFAVAAPAAYVGLRILGGDLSLDGPTHSSAPIRLDPQGSVTLSFELEPQAQDGPGATRATLPQHVTLRLTPHGVDTIETADLSLQLDSGTFDLHYGGDPAHYEAALNAIFIPFESQPGPITIASPTTGLYMFGGRAAIEAGAWTLPITDTHPDLLGEASGIGALALVLAPGLTVTWSDLGGAPARLQRVFLEASNGLLAIVAPDADNRRNRHQFLLWRESGSMRRSSLDVTFGQPRTLRLLSSHEGMDAVLATATLTAHLDRPLHADGSRVGFRASNAMFRIVEDASARRVQISAVIPPPHAAVSIPAVIAPIAISNALLHTTRTQALSLAGIVESDSSVAAGLLMVAFGLYGVLPILPDPYASNSEILPLHTLESAPAVLVAMLACEQTAVPEIRFSAAPVREDAELPALLPPPRPAMPVHPDEVGEGALRAIFDQTLRINAGERALLLDMSSNADQLGVGIGFRNVRGSRDTEITVRNLDLIAPGFNVRVFLLPQVQWEPVRTEPQPVPPFPQTLHSRDDGGPTFIGVDTVSLTPIAPLPVVSALLDAYRESAPGAVLFTLPFGIKAVARLEAERVLQDGHIFYSKPTLRLNQPDFGRLTGARQITLEAAPRLLPNVNRFLPGAALQTRNGVSLSGPPFTGSVLDLIEGFFNNAFGPASPRPRVPLTRIDFSGYGASSQSQWDDPNTQIGVSMVRFDVLRGRTSYEVVRVKSILWPCQAPVVREITLERRGNASVVRSDSGWVATGPGLFEAPQSQCVFHSGVVKGYHNIREIRDTRQFSTPAGARLQAVYFDAEIAFEDVTRGRSGSGVDRHGEPVGFVAVQNQLGFVQHEPQSTVNQPQGVPLNPWQLAQLIAQVGPIGGLVDCELDVGRSRQRMPIGGVYASAVPTAPPTPPQFAVAAFGSLKLPQPGQWSFARVQRHGPGIVGTDEADPQSVDSRFGIPVIREGRPSVSRAMNVNPYRFADPPDLLRPADPDADYALLFSGEAYRVLFPRPIIRAHERRITSELPPLLADPYAMLNGNLLFPKAKHCLPFPNNQYSLEIPGEGLLRLAPSPFTFTIPQRTRELRTFSGGRLALEYFDTKPNIRLANVELRIDPAQNPPNSLVLGPVGVLVDVGPFPGLMRVVSRLEAHSPAHFTPPIIRYGSVLDPVGEIITVLQNFGLPNPLALVLPFAGDPDAKLKISLVLDIAELMQFGKHKEPGEPADKNKRVNLGIAKWGGSIKSGVELWLNTSECAAYIEFAGDAQQKIFPGLYAGGFGKFKISCSTKDPSEEIELALGVIGSVGGDLVRGLFEVEATVKYGYMLILGNPIKPGLILGMEAKAKILPKKLKGLVAVTFEWEGQAVLAPNHNAAHPEDSTLLIEAKVMVALNLGLALFFEVGIEFEGEFEQEVPLEVVVALGIAMGVGLLPPP